MEYEYYDNGFKLQNVIDPFPSNIFVCKKHLIATKWMD